MKELSLNILDIAENSFKAGAAFTEIIIEETDETLVFKIIDNGCGMDEEMVKSVINPFCTTRTTRKVGLGIPLLKDAAELTGGNIDIKSKIGENSGTTVTALFYKNHIDFTPLGDIVSTITTILQGHPDTDFLFCHKINGGEVVLDTREIRAVLEDVPLNCYDVIKWVEGNLLEQYQDLKNK